MKRRQLLLRAGLGASMGLALSLPARADSYQDYFNYLALDRPESVRDLLRKGFDVNARNAKGQHGLTVALQEGSARSVELLSNWPGLDPESPNAQGETLLMMAAIKGQVTVMARLIALGAVVNRPGWTPLHYAASGGSEAAIEFLLGQGARLEARAPNGNTPLMMAAGYGTIDSARLLMRRGADPRLEDNGGGVAAVYARKAGREGLAKELETRAAALGPAPAAAPAAAPETKPLG